MLLGKLLSEPLGANQLYLGDRHQFSRSVLSSSDLTSAFSDLLKHCKNESPCGQHLHVSWISPETWQLIDHHAAMHWQPGLSFTEFHHLLHQIQRSLWADHTRHLNTAGEAVESALAGGDLKEAWQILKQWYYHTTGRPMKPSYQDMWSIECEFGALYNATPPLSNPIPVLAPHSNIDDAPPTEAKIALAVHCLCSGHAPGPSLIWAEHLKQFLKAAERMENLDHVAWDKLVHLVHTMFLTSELPD